MSISLIDASADTLTVSWPESESGSSPVRYVLQYRKAKTDDDTEANFETLSDKLTSTQARKKNLTDDDKHGFLFRVTTLEDALDVNDPAVNWMTHSEPFCLLSQEDDQTRMAAPTVVHAGSHLAGLVSWNLFPEAISFELQMRENKGGAAWDTIAPNFKGSQVKKKNLSSPQGYQFRVRPTLGQLDEDDLKTTIIGPFSPPSNIYVALGLSTGMQQLFAQNLERQILVRGQTQRNLEEALGGKEFVLLYASAHWCGPCRQFTPQLINWYNSLGANRTVEVVFVSADHDGPSFLNYYNTMPWLAIPYDDDGREGLMHHIRVQGIPQLAVLDGKTGRIIETNAVGQSMDINRWRRLAAISS